MKEEEDEDEVCTMGVPATQDQLRSTTKKEDEPIRGWIETELKLQNGLEVEAPSVQERSFLEDPVEWKIGGKERERKIVAAPQLILTGEAQVMVPLHRERNGVGLNKIF